MTTERAFRALCRHLAADQRITVWHYSLYMSLFNKWSAGGFVNPISISRREMMAQAHVGSLMTYHKCIRQLTEFGYIIYEPSYNPFIGSYVSLLVPGKC